MDFHGIELLTLSGCQTGMSTRSDGRKIDGLGFAAKDKGAKATMATLSASFQRAKKSWQAMRLLALSP
jgi:hypothetical protein